MFSRLSTTDGSALKTNWLNMVSYLTSTIPHSRIFNVGFWTDNLFRIDGGCSEIPGIQDASLSGLPRSFVSIALILAPSHDFRPLIALMSHALNITSEQITVSKLFLYLQSLALGIMSLDVIIAILVWRAASKANSCFELSSSYGEFTLVNNPAPINPPVLYRCAAIRPRPFRIPPLRGCFAMQQEALALAPHSR